MPPLLPCAPGMFLRDTDLAGRESDVWDVASFVGVGVLAALPAENR